MVKLHIKTSKIGATGTSDNVRKGRTYVLLGILFFQNSGGAGVRIHLSGRMPPLSSIPPCLCPDHCDQHRHNRDTNRTQRRLHESRRLYAQNDRESLIDLPGSSNVEVETHGKNFWLDFRTASCSEKFH